MRTIASLREPNVVDALTFAGIVGRTVAGYVPDPERGRAYLAEVCAPRQRSRSPRRSAPPPPLPRPRPRAPVGPLAPPRPLSALARAAPQRAPPPPRPPGADARAPPHRAPPRPAPARPRPAPVPPPRPAPPRALPAPEPAGSPEAPNAGYDAVYALSDDELTVPVALGPPLAASNVDWGVRLRGNPNMVGRVCDPSPLNPVEVVRVASAAGYSAPLEEWSALAKVLALAPEMAAPGMLVLSAEDVWGCGVCPPQARSGRPPPVLGSAHCEQLHHLRAVKSRHPSGAALVAASVHAFGWTEAPHPSYATLASNLEFETLARRTEQARATLETEPFLLRRHSLKQEPAGR